MPSRVHRNLIFSLFLSGMPFLAADPAGSACHEHRDTTNPAFSLHLSGCSEEERHARAIRASTILNALQQGIRVDLSGVIVRGDLSLDDLPPIEPKTSRALSAHDQQALQNLNVSSVRVVSASFSIRDSVVLGKIGHRKRDAMLVMTGPVLFTNTRFEDEVDLSRTVFLQRVDCSSCVFLKGAYFVQGRFHQQALFAQAIFGPHTRFHRAVFAGVTSFARSRFGGLAEFLEVTFEQPVNFADSEFLSGTGFSGSHFNGGDFSRALFDKDVYFLFASFKGEVKFSGAWFRSVVDFSDAEASGIRDLPQEVLTKPVRTPTALERVSAPGGWISRYGVTLSLLLLSLVLVLYLFKMK